ncbi:MAG: hypothetical protein EPN26_00935 [Rhodospirillales bacterium]|nr:MAG: hypothetical protein EPN26_00935 [Rhodospirillales bacterium]
MRALILLSLFALAGCATQSASQAWIHPDWGTSSTSRDLTTCRKNADEDLGRKLGHDDVLDRSPSDWGSSPTRTTDNIRTRYEFDRYVANCMMALGYRRTKAQ